MRIQANKLCTEPSKELEQFFLGIYKYIDTEYLHRGSDNLCKGCLCEECGTELYGIWYTYSSSYVNNLLQFYSKNIPSFNDDSIIEKGKRLANELDSQREAAKAEMEEKIICPICGKENEYGYFSGKGESIDQRLADYFDKENRSMRSRLKFAGKLNVWELISKCHSSVGTPTFSNISSIKDNPEQLKRYIFNLIQMESNIMLLKKHLEVLCGERAIATFDVRRVNYEPIIIAKEHKKALQKQYDEAVKRYKDRTEQLESCKSNCPQTVDIPMPAKPMEPQFARPGLFNKKKVLEHNENLKVQYEKDLKKYEQRCKERLTEIEQKTKEAKKKHQANIQDAEKALQKAKTEMDQLRGRLNSCTPRKAVEVCPEKAKLAMVEDEIGKTLELLTKTYEARDTLYAANIVFGKYRDIVALSTFYEYLMAGRCASLEGSNGAYNLYEMEIRANMIVTQLTQIEESLQKIQRTQYMICGQLSEMSKALDQMNSTMSAAYGAITDIRANTNDMTAYMANIAKNSNVIAHNTTVTAYYSKVNAELTNALGFMLALK